MLLSTKFSLVYLLFAIFSLTGVGMMMFEDEEPPEEDEDVVWEIVTPSAGYQYLDSATNIESRGNKPEDKGGKIRVYHADGSGWHHLKTKLISASDKTTWGNYKLS